MTVVLALRCANGLVLASDSQATDLAAGNIAFATKATVQKLFSLGYHIAWGATGNAGLIQRFDHQLKLINPADLEKPIEELRITLGNAQRQMQAQAFAETQQALGGVPQIGPLFAGCTAGRSWILEVTPSGEDTIYEDHYAVGSGGTFAKQAMASVAHYELGDRNLAEAQVIAWRALDGCIETSAWGIGKPILICTVTSNGVQLLDEDELQSVEDSVNAWKAAEVEALGSLGLGGIAGGEPASDADDGIEP